MSGPHAMPYHMYAFRYPLALGLVGALALTSCNKDDDGPSSTSEGQVRLEMTDAPIDDAGIEAVFVTVAEVRIDGQTQANLSERTTFDISELQNGRTLQIGSDQRLAAGSHSDIEIDFDLASDADGTGPGCYVLNADGTKDALTFGNETSATVKAALAFEARADATTRIVADLNLRKAVERESEGARAYTFGSVAKLNASTRVVDAEATGTVEGNIDMSDNSTARGDKFVVFAYEEGAYERDAETDADFGGAVSSAEVDSSGDFTLAFLMAGDYELVVVAYADEDQDGTQEYKGTFASEGVINADTRAVSVSAKASTELSLSIGALLP